MGDATTRIVRQVMKRCLIFNPYWDTMGGGERYVSTVARILLELDWEVNIVWSENLVTQVLDRFGIDISKAIFTPNNHTFGYDLVFWLSDGSLPLSFAKKTLIHMQFPFTDIGGSRLLNRAKSMMYKFVCNSQFTKSFIDKEFLVNSQVIYPPIEVSHFSPGIKNNAILYVGRFSNLTQHKHPDILIESFKKISDRIPGWELILAGGSGIGADKATFSILKKLASNYPVRFITNPSFAQLQTLYAQASIFWSASGFGVNPQTNPTQVEHFGITVIEAMSSGAVPLLTDLGGHKEIVESGINGYLWHTPQELEEKSIYLIKHANLIKKMSALAISRSQAFDINIFKNDLIKLT